MAVVFGLASAASWGAGDFSGGVATRRTPVYGVVILAAARLASIATIVLLAGPSHQRVALATSQLPLIAQIGLFDTSGNAFYALAAQAGRLDVATVLSSLYPTGTGLLARFVLKEQLSHSQWIGVVTALLVVLLITS